MPVEYADIILAVAALFAAILYLRPPRRHRKKKAAPPVRPASPNNQTAGVASTWAPPAATHPVAPTIVFPPPAGPSWDQPAASPAKPSAASSPSWGAPSSASAAPAPTWGSPAGAVPPAGQPPGPP